MPICSRSNPVLAQEWGWTKNYEEPEVRWDCTDQPLPSDPDGQIVYDLIPRDPSRGYCYGQLCVDAARAIDGYRAFLHRFSGFRTAVVHAMLARTCAATTGPPRHRPTSLLYLLQ